MAFEKAGDLGHIGHNAADVRRRRERADHQPPLPALQRRLERRKVRPAVHGLGDLDHLGPAFPPRQDVGMMLIGADQHERRLAPRHGIVHTQKPHDPIERRSCAGAGKDHRVALIRTALTGDKGARLAAQARHGRPAERAFGVAVGVIGKNVIQDRPLDLHERPARGDVIGIDHLLGPHRPLDHDPFPDQPLAKHGKRIAGLERLLEIVEVAFGHSSSPFPGKLPNRRREYLLKLVVVLESFVSNDLHDR